MSSQKKYIENVAIIGAGGQVGSHIAAALIAQGKHRVTAISRPSSRSQLPAGVHAVKRAEYSDHAALVSALQGQEALVITLAALAAPETQTQIIDAAIAAGVQYIMPNEYGGDAANAALAADTLLGDRYLATRRHIETHGGGRTHWLALTCSFWYEFSLAGYEERFGFDFGRKALTLIDDGATRICTSTWAQCGRAVAALLALPVEPPSSSSPESGGRSLAAFANRATLISSFVVSQRDMLASVLRVTGDAEADWTLTSEPHAARFARGQRMMQAGDMMGFALLLYARVFYPDGCGDFSARLDNAALGLPEEDLDAATREALRMHAAGAVPTFEEMKASQGTAAH